MCDNNYEISLSIDNIREKLNTMACEEYAKNNYIPIKKSAKELKEPTENKLDLISFKNKMQKMNQEKNKNKIYNPVDITDNNLILNKCNILNDDSIFNIIDEKEKYLEWRKLSIEDKLNILNIYLESTNKYGCPYSEEIKEEIRELVKNKKLLYKKDITYDKINKKISNIPLIKYVDGIFFLKQDVKKISIKKKNINNVNKIFK